MNEERIGKILKELAVAGEDKSEILRVAGILFPNDDSGVIKQLVDGVIAKPTAEWGSVKSKIEEWLCDNNGTISGQVCDKDLGFGTSRDKSTRRKIFQRFVKGGRLVRVKSKVDTFRVIPEIQEVEKDKVIGEAIDIELPFGLENFAKIYPGDLIVIAGLSNVGKTALMLNLAWKNKHLDCWYFSSEMGGVKCKDTISNFAEEPDWAKWPFHFVEDFEDYETIIRPDGINFIDYLEEDEGKYFEIPSIERAMQHRLNKGVAFVAIQKQPGRDYGLGGYNTIAKTGLYLTMDGTFEDTYMTIKKCKVPTGKSVFNYKIHFTIDGGINLRTDDTWGREEDNE